MLPGGPGRRRVWGARQGRGQRAGGGRPAGLPPPSKPEGRPLGRGPSGQHGHLSLYLPLITVMFAHGKIKKGRGAWEPSACAPWGPGGGRQAPRPPGPSRPAPPVAAGRRRAREDQPHLQGREERARGGLQRPEALLRKHFPRTDRSRQRSVVVLAGAPRDAAGACPAAGRPPRPRHLKARAALALRRARFLAERGDHVPALLFPLVYALILIF